MERVVMCCQYSDVILWNCIYLYYLYVMFSHVRWCYSRELYLRVVMCCQYVDVILWNCIYLYGTFVTCLTQWCYTMELHLFVCLFERVVMCLFVLCLFVLCLFVLCLFRIVFVILLWNCIYLYGTCCDLCCSLCYTMVYLYCVYYGLCLFDCVYLQWCYTMELCLFIVFLYCV